MTDLITAEEAQKLLDGATPGPWRADGEPWNRVVWSSADNRVCFMAHSSGLNDARDIATSNLIAAAPDLARALLAARAELARVKADAAVAVALMVERAATQADPWDGPVTKNKIVDAQAIAAQQIKARIRALAPADGLALVQELRAERDAADQRDGAMLARIVALEADGEAARSAASTNFARAETAEAERDRLAAANAVLEAKVAGLRDFVDDFAKAKIDALRSSPPYGSSPEDDPDPVVDAETVWAWQADAKAALATQEAGTC